MSDNEDIFFGVILILVSIGIWTRLFSVDIIIITFKIDIGVDVSILSFIIY